MKKILILVIIALVVAGIIMFGIGKGLGNGIGDGKGDGNTSIKTEQTDSSHQNTIDEVKNTPTGIPTKKPEDEIEENKELDSQTIIHVNVVGNEYFYNNSRISLIELVTDIKTKEGILVEVNDEEASNNAYQKLIDKLKEERIKYVENE